ncbi:terpenoid synthase [Basidiobolus meristosporus CBS 931.73]|uniref:Terpene synthase n=1 Tax=Basidiobolus meristosporus CBS 931.73 TaxID=1314790 RepID=A0A1Y1YDI0_9FUNG|nr:terpenoid synthase [Basidiobolus meristosporus CBS 931.73]|eukprot:ORX95684.1 terpenoid synthase [Basidiobolus meristosporus CBS 931.73]
MKITLPPFDFLPPTSLCHDYKKIESDTLLWLTQKQLVQGKDAVERLVQSKLTNLACRVHPTAKYDRLLWVAKLYAWLFMFDDQFDDSKLGQDKTQMYIIFIALLSIFNTKVTKKYTAEFTQNVMALLKDDRPEEYSEEMSLSAICNAEIKQIQHSPIYCSLAELWAELSRATSIEVQEKVTANFVNYLNAYIFECEMRQVTRYPDVETYIKNRQDSGSMRLCLEVIGYVEGVYLPEEILSSPQFNTLKDQCINVVCWVNDIYSFEKEYEKGDIHNLVMVLKQARDITFDESVEQVRQMVNQEMDNFFATKAEFEKLVSHNYSPEVYHALGRYIVTFEAWCRGNLDWSIESGRFKKVIQSEQYLEEILSNKTNAIQNDNNWFVQLKLLSHNKPVSAIVNGSFYLLVLVALVLYHLS